MNRWYKWMISLINDRQIALTVPQFIITSRYFKIIQSLEWIVWKKSNLGTKRLHIFLFLSPATAQSPQYRKTIITPKTLASSLWHRHENFTYYRFLDSSLRHIWREHSTPYQRVLLRVFSPNNTNYSSVLMLLHMMDYLSKLYLWCNLQNRHGSLMDTSYVLGYKKYKFVS